MKKVDYATLVRRAEERRKTHLREAVSILRGRVLGSMDPYGPWIRELEYVNKYITVPQEEIDKATRAYEEVGRHLQEAFKLSGDDIAVLPQGSAATQTLIRTPGNGNFDIDAVCQMDITRINTIDPIDFFEKVGGPLERYEAERKNRCWSLPCSGEPFYLEFTPSVPLANVSQETLNNMAPRFLRSMEYLDTALAVVDRGFEEWKTSNPQGFAKWVSDTAQRPLLKAQKTVSFFESLRSDVGPVPTQEVELTDTLRVAIRLFKRHRDMCVRRGIIDSKRKPISVIIVTLLTACYGGLADLGKQYDHPFELLLDLAELLPGMVDTKTGEYHVDNPTVPGENFAEKWNEESDKRADEFIKWTKILAQDIETILYTEGESEVKYKVRQIFGCEGPAPGTGESGGDGGSRLSDRRRPVRPVPPTRGLA